MHFHSFKLKYSSTEQKELVYRKIFKGDLHFLYYWTSFLYSKGERWKPWCQRSRFLFDIMLM